MEEIHDAFVQEPEFRPLLEISSQVDDMQIPVIDLSLQGADVDTLKSQIGSACENWGFFQVINHGVPAELRNQIETLAKQFFHQPLDQKQIVKRDEVNSMGFHDSEHTKNVRDWKQVFDFLLLDPTLIPATENPSDHELRTLKNQWPNYPSQFREVCEEFAETMQTLAFRLLEIISSSLGIAKDRLNGFFEDQTSFCRLNYYPTCPEPGLALGVGGHKDSGALTVLAQDDVGGLQVRRKVDGLWIPVPPLAGALIVNIGNCLQVWSNDRYWSAEHRVVVNSERERFSVPFFLFPSHYVQVRPLDELVCHHRPAKYREYNWGKFLANRNRSDYQKRTKENIQIDHFKL